MMNEDIALYKELIAFCNSHQAEIETKFTETLDYSELNEKCYEEMFFKCRNIEAPLPVKHFKEIIPGLAEAYSVNIPKYLTPRNRYNKGMDIQKGDWYEKGLKLFLSTKGIEVTKMGFPFPDFEVKIGGRVVGYYELKYIEAPFVLASTKMKETYPYNSTRYDYEASLTLDTGRKMDEQRAKIERDLLPQGIPVHFLWWYDCFHIKGLFAMSAQDVFNYHDNLSGDVWTRAAREGDFIKKQIRTKIYPPLLNMITFSEYINLLIAQ
ncbi:MAG: hypothetical protein MR330_04975 [Rikenellaceae bacterium]|nr:hypothetical protein [Rikenellaceae bacterium]